ncbi:1700006A11Rik protein [Apodemus speciosus]|uniref:1700006A11Rik protein n=1 Tax=Apodemus speciosus TaxID=105296 RepID=A0ABQ0ELX1_APOSI
MTGHIFSSYQVIMSYLQDTSGPKELGNCTDIPTLPGQCGGHLNLDAQEQFIPKPRDQSRSSQHSDAERKTVNKRRPFITRDMLSLLNEKGPITEGIFRISANIAACQALKEKLDSGKKVNLKKECVLVVASVLKISLVKFLIENSLKIFGEDMVLCYSESSVSCPDVEKASCSPNNITYLGEMKDKEYLDNHSQSGRTCPTGNDSEPMSLAALLHNEESIDSKKPVKRPFIKPIITCGSTTSHDNVCMTPFTATSNNGHLFGKSLTSLCRDGNLPAPILDMLSIIDEKGPDTERIFRTLANKSHFALKEKLDSAKEMNLREESVYVVASVLKEFIRNIQGSLLHSNLYEKWLDVPDQESHDQKISAIQSFRIAPNMLWNPTASNSVFGNDLSKKISIVELLIESFLEIFGEDATIFYGEITKSCSDIAKAFGSLNNVAESNKMRNPRGDNRGSCYSEKTHPQQNEEESLSASPYKQLQEEVTSSMWIGQIGSGRRTFSQRLNT